MSRLITLLLAGALPVGALPLSAQTVAPPAAITAENIPAIPASLADAVRPYLEYRTAAFEDWDAKTRGILVATRFGNAAQLARVATPGGDRRQISFENEPIPVAAAADDGTIVLVKDVGGAEFFQLYRLDKGRLILLTDGKSRNTGLTWSPDGKRIGYGSTRRNGTDTDLYVMDPRDPASDRRVAQLSGGGWGFEAFSADGGKALVVQRLSVERAEVHELDLASGALVRLTSGKPASFANARYAPDGSILVLSDAGADVMRLGRLDRRGGFTPLSKAPAAWEAEDFAIARDGSFVATVFNEAGVSKLRLVGLDGTAKGEPALPAGVITGLKIAPWGAIGFSLASATSPADAWSVDPATLQATRWTFSETGGLDAAANREPELVKVRSFDGVEVSGFLYTPDPARFPGKRPLIVDIHGGPEGQTRPGFLGRANYLVNELGLAVFYPNVRGSTGYGRRFVGLDNGPWQRENTVKDIGAFLDALTARPDIDPARVAETGASYGGYMCNAVAIAYGARLKSALCLRAISNFVTLLENTESYRRDLRRVEYGDERDPKARAKLTEISPLTRAGEIRLPMMLVTGSNDPRVKPSESYQMAAAVRKNGVPVWHLIAANEGHGYQKKENLDFQFLATVTFWQTTLLK
ncbi:peptidase [alpha proteobacterium AAP81b]|nr:peptidase [alpha proteobacterium AAP81b]